MNLSSDRVDIEPTVLRKSQFLANSNFSWSNDRIGKKTYHKQRRFTICLCYPYLYVYIYISGAEMGLVLLVPGTTNNSVNVIQNGLKIIH